MDTPESLRETAERCRRLASQCTDHEFREKLERLALDCEAKLADGEWPGRPAGR